MDKETFSTLVHEQQRQLYRIAVSYTASSADAEDAMQEALLRAWKRAGYPAQSCLLQHMAQPHSHQRVQNAAAQTQAAAPHRRPAQPRGSTAGRTSHALRTALFALPEKYRVPLVLNLLEGYTLREIAAMLSLPVGTVKTRIARAKQKLEQEVSVHA